MNHLAKTLAFATALAVASSPYAMAQTGGADVPTGAAKAGAAENGPSSTGGKGAMKGSGGMMKKHKKKKKSM